MSTVTETAKSQRISITVPNRILERLRRVTSGRTVSRFFAEAVDEKIAREEQEQAFKALLEAPPTLTELGDAVEYVKTLRKEDALRDKRLGI